MRPKILLPLVLAGALALTTTACGDDDDNGSNGGSTPSVTDTQTQTDAAAAGTIVDVAGDTPTLSTLTSAVVAAGLDETLAGPGPYTVFAPTDDAFAALPTGVVDQLLLPCNADALTTVLTYHVLPTEVPSSDVESGDVTTVEGSDVTVEVADGSVNVGEATVVQPDVEADNGVVHVIDGVLLPESFDPATLEAEC